MGELLEEGGFSKVKGMSCEVSNKNFSLKTVSKTLNYYYYLLLLYDIIGKCVRTLEAHLSNYHQMGCPKMRSVVIDLKF